MLQNRVATSNHQTSAPESGKRWWTGVTVAKTANVGPRGLPLIAIAALVACDYRSFRDCTVSCTAATGCPDGLTCSGEGFCRVAGATGACAFDIDARVDLDAPPVLPDAAPVTFEVSGARQTFAVPASATKLRIVAEGASGGDSDTFRGGFGAIVETVATVTPGESILVVVGEWPLTQVKGMDGCGGSGGGGSFVIRAAGSEPLAVAGGGGGASAYTATGMSSDGGDASLTTDGGASGAIPGGTNGSGGPGNTQEGGGGGGLLSDGGSGIAGGGRSFGNGSTGGANDPSEMCGANRGGLGGGGGGGNDLAGGGGGYSGGAAHTGANQHSGGGGSFGAGTPTIRLRTTRSAGRVVLTPGA